MRRKFLMLVVGAFMVLGAGVVLPADTAVADDYDNYATLFCEVHKSGSEQTIIHAWPYALEPGYRIDVCTQDFFGVRHQFFVKWNVNTFTHQRVSGYQPCSVVFCTPHG